MCNCRLYGSVITCINMKGEVQLRSTSWSSPVRPSRPAAGAAKRSIGRADPAVAPSRGSVDAWRVALLHRVEPLLGCRRTVGALALVTVVPGLHTAFVTWARHAPVYHASACAATGRLYWLPVNPDLSQHGPAACNAGAADHSSGLPVGQAVVSPNRPVIQLSGWYRATAPPRGIRPVPGRSRSRAGGRRGRSCRRLSARPSRGHMRAPWPRSLGTALTRSR